MRAIGSLNLKFGLVNIPLRVNSFLDYQGISFRQLCPYCKNPINYLRVCKNCKKEIPYNELLNGFQLSKNNIIIVDKEKINNLNLETRIVAIVDRDKEPEFLTEKCYLLTPDKVRKPYFLLREILIKLNKEIVVEFALRKQLHLGIIKPITINGITYLMLKQILYADKIKDIEPLKEEQIDEKELELGLKLFEMIHSSLEKVNFLELKDRRKELLEKVLKGEIEVEIPKEAIGEAKSMLEEIKKSLEVMKKEKKEV